MEDIDGDIIEDDVYLDKYITQIKVTVNTQELNWLRRGMVALKQVKPSTALKQLARLGVMKMDSDSEMVKFLAENYRLNEKTGIADISREVENSLRKVPKI